MKKRCGKTSLDALFDPPLRYASDVHILVMLDQDVGYWRCDRSAFSFGNTPPVQAILLAGMAVRVQASSPGKTSVVIKKEM